MPSSRYLLETYDYDCVLTMKFLEHIEDDLGILGKSFLARPDHRRGPRCNDALFNDYALVELAPVHLTHAPARDGREHAAPMESIGRALAAAMPAADIVFQLTCLRIPNDRTGQLPQILTVTARRGPSSASP